MTSDTDIPAGRATRGPEAATDFDAGPVDIATIEAARAALGDLIVETPVLRWQGREIDALVPPGTEVVLKLELMQRAGSFKARGALLNVMALDAAARARGVTAVSAGNHAIATSYAAWRLGVDAKVVMMKTASPFRVDACRAYGAEVVLAEDVQAAFAQVHDLVEGEGRTLVHPFEGPRTALGTATMGLEFLGQAPGLDAVVIPIGGGGLSAGASAAILLALAAGMDPGQQVLLPDPGYACNRPFVTARGGIPVALPVSAENAFQPTAREVASAWGEETRAVLLASPANPTGTCLAPEQLAAIMDVVRARGGLVIMDEIYAQIVFDPGAPSAAAAFPDVVVINSFSKYFAMTGWRLGWMVVPEAWIEPVRRLAQNLFVAPSTPAQSAALAAFEPYTGARLQA
ncbi:MAG: pyridoxal-phosphate dependent enzyme, partial [Alphaproteobacteria bacterium]|nr:pyridoxal-phosphate dependent enzyme [Alphaproteobacteria bacterium]